MLLPPPLLLLRDTRNERTRINAADILSRAADRDRSSVPVVRWKGGRKTTSRISIQNSGWKFPPDPCPIFIQERIPSVGGLPQQDLPVQAFWGDVRSGGIPVHTPSPRRTKSYRARSSSTSARTACSGTTRKASHTPPPNACCHGRGAPRHVWSRTRYHPRV